MNGTLNITPQDGATVTFVSPAIPKLNFVAPVSASAFTLTGISGPQGERGPQGPPGVAGNIEGDLPDFTLLFENKLI